MTEQNELPREALKKARENRGLSQAKLAELVGVESKTVRLWEQGKSDPYPYHRRKLAEHLGITPEDLEALLANRPHQPLQLQSQEQEPRRRWIIPYQPNPYFTGRDRLLVDLHTTFLSDITSVSRQVLTGLPGIGKTQVAIEYAYRYHEAYQAILWATAETEEALMSDFVRMASILCLPEKDEQDKQRIIDGVKQWLNSNRDWLLVLDNVGDPNLLNGFLPQEDKGHVLLTSRDPEAVLGATTITVEKMEIEVGATLLLRRARVLRRQETIGEASELEREKALEISKQMDGHPLALDQAGAYIAETSCTVAEYLDFYLARRKKLLDDRGRNYLGHPDSLATTIHLSLEKVEQVNPVAANLLRMCAFIHPDDIPEELFTTGDFALPATYHPVAADAYFLTEAIRVLVRYSFIQRCTEVKTVSVHRLVQDVLKDQMNYEMQFRWASHTVWVVARTLSHLELGAWNQYQRYIPHAIVCIKLVDVWQIYYEATVYLTILVGAYLRESASYTQAEPICLQALQLAQAILEPEHAFVILGLHNLAMLYEHWGDYEKAESYYLEAVETCSRKPDPNTLTSANIFNSLARLYMLRGKYSEAESVAQQALAIRESLSGTDAPEVASSLGTLAEIHSIQRKYRQAEPLLQRALAIREKGQKTDPLSLALSLNSFMLFYIGQGKHKKARPFCQRVLEIMEKERGPKHPEVAKICNNIAEVYRHLGEISKAEHYCKRAFEIFEEVYGSNSVHVIPTLCMLAAIYQKQGNYAEAESLFKQALAVTAEKLGPEHPNMASVLSAYVLLIREMERYDEADELDEKALHINRLWLEEASPLEMLREEYAAMQRKYLRKGGTVIYNGVSMTVEEFLALQTDSPEDEDTTPPEETASN